MCRTTPVRTAAELLWAIRANRRAAPLQSVPIYLFHGGDDKIADPEGSRDLYAAWGCRDKTLRIWPESRHEALNDFDKEVVMNAMFDWFSQKTTNPGSVFNP